MSKALMVQDADLDINLKKLIQVGIWDQYIDGLYLPKEKQIILCANTLIYRNEFANAFYRQTVKLYDHSRSKNYNFKNCKHLACTEVRAASFSDACNSPALSKGKFELKSSSQEKLDADNYWIKNLAINYLKETPLCEKHSESYVQAVFDKWIKDNAPFGSTMVQKTRSLTDIL